MEKRKISILFIVNSLEFGGAEKHVVSLVNTLDTSRFRLSLAYLKNDDKLLPQVHHERVEGGVFCCHVSRKIDLRAARRLSDHLRGEAVDVVVCTNPYSLLYGWLARLRSGRRPRIVEVFHSTELGTMEDELQMLFYRPLVFASDSLVYVCENQRKYWQPRALRARSEIVIHNGIDVEQFADRYSVEEKRFLRQGYYFGVDDYVVGLCAAMRPEKAHGDLLRAVAHLRSVSLNVKCLFIGDGPARAGIEAQIDAMGLTQHVRITGFADDVRPLIAACDVMAIVSHHVETFSIAALEAMALGKPMVMSRIGGAAEQVVSGENGYLYTRGDIVALAHALGELSDREKCRQMGARARSIVAQRFSVDVMADAYARLFAGLAHAANSAAEAENAV